MSRPFAVFDIDGTLIRWQLYHALADQMVRDGLIDAAQYQAVRDARMDWKTRAHDSSYQDYEATLINLIDKAIMQITASDLQAACQTVIEQYKDQVYTYTRDLIEELRSRKYLLFAISASQTEIVEMLANYYKFDDFGGSVYEVKAGRFTGNKEVLKSDRKPEYLKHLVEKHHAQWKDSVGVGDSEGDIPMLSTVDQAIAFNPTRQLFEYARLKQWEVVVERKNMIYRLEPGNGSYLLA